MKIVVGLILLSLGVSLFVLSLFNATITDTVIDISLVLKPGEERGPGVNGIYHHTRVITKSALMGEVLVDGEAINFTANGYNTLHLKNILIDQNYSFLIDPADDLYWFAFENIGSIQSSIQFTLKEKWINFFLLVPGFASLLILTTTGLALSLMSIRKKPTQVHKFHKSAGIGLILVQILGIIEDPIYRLNKR